MPSDLVVNFLANVRPFQQGVQEFKAQSTGLLSEMGGLGGLMSKALPYVGAAVLTRQLIDTAGRFDDMSDAAEKMGVTFQNFQRWKTIMEESGGSVGSLEGGFARLQKQIGEALDGSKEARAAFDKLGLAAGDLAGMLPEEQLVATARAIGAMGSETQRAIAMMELFGRSGKELKPVLDAIAEGRDKEVFVVPSAAAEALADFGDRWERLRRDYAPTVLGYFVKIASLGDIGSGGAEVISRRQAEARAFREATEAAEALAAAHERIDKAQKAREKNLTGMEGFLDQVRGQVQDLGLSPVEQQVRALQERFQEFYHELAGDQGVATSQLVTYYQQFQQLIGAMREANELQEKRRAMQEELSAGERQFNQDAQAGLRIIQDNLTPQEKLKQQLEEIARLKEAGLLGFGERAEQTAARARTRAAREFIESTGGVRGPSGPLYAEPAIGLQDAWRAVQEIMEQDREDRNREEEKALLESIATSCGIMACTEAEAEALVEISY